MGSCQSVIRVTISNPEVSIEAKCNGSWQCHSRSWNMVLNGRSQLIQRVAVPKDQVLSDNSRSELQVAESQGRTFVESCSFHKWTWGLRLLSGADFGCKVVVLYVSPVFSPWKNGAILIILSRCPMCMMHCLITDLDSSGISISPVLRSILRSFVISTAGRSGHLKIKSCQIMLLWATVHTNILKMRGRGKHRGRTSPLGSSSGSHVYCTWRYTLSYLRQRVPMRHWSYLFLIGDISFSLSPRGRIVRVMPWDCQKNRLQMIIMGNSLKAWNG